MIRTASLAVIALVAFAPAAAQQAKPATTYDRAIAAGYKAAMLCSGIFDAKAVGAHRDRTSIEANELVGIYPEYDGLIASMPATVGRDSVTVAYDPAMPPRLAVSKGRAGCTIEPIGSIEPVYDIVAEANAPRGDWPASDTNATAKAQGNAAALDAGIARAFAGGYGRGADTTAVIIVQNGKIVGERYAGGFGIDTPERTWSVAKSIAGTLIGIAVKDGAIATDAPAPIPEWQTPGDPRQAIRLDNLMRMASGLHSDAAGNRTDPVYFGGTSVTERTVFWPLETTPGTRFRYANDDILLAVRSLRAKLGASFSPRAMLFDRIGMSHTIAETDWQGNYILSSQVWSSARDLARLGLLYLNDGVWQGQRLLPAGWIKFVTTPSGPQPPGDFGYGATFWLIDHSPGVPADTFAGFGNRGQYVVIVPSRRVVVVRRGEDPGRARFDIAKFTADILAALK